jgi:hypothetical protein
MANGNNHGKNALAICQKRAVSGNEINDEVRCAVGGNEKSPEIRPEKTGCQKGVPFHPKPSSSNCSLWP